MRVRNLKTDVCGYKLDTRGTQFAVALFVFLAAAARTRVVRTRFLVHMYRLGTLLLTRVTACRSGCPGRLCRLLHRIFLRAVAAVVHTALLLCLLYTVGFLRMNLSTQQDSNSTAVERVKHLFEDIERLKLVDQ